MQISCSVVWLWSTRSSHTLALSEIFTTYAKIVALFIDFATLKPLTVFHFIKILCDGPNIKLSITLVQKYNYAWFLKYCTHKNLETMESLCIEFLNWNHKQKQWHNTAGWSGCSLYTHIFKLRKSSSSWAKTVRNKITKSTKLLCKFCHNFKHFNA